MLPSAEIEANVRLGQRLLDALNMPRLLAHQLFARSRQRAQVMHLFVGNEARLDQAMGGEVRNPHRVVHVRLAAWNRLDVSRVGDDKLEFALAQYLPDRKPIDPGRLHRRQAAPLGVQPLQQGQETFGRRRIRSTFPRRPIPGHRPHASDHGILVNVQAGDAIVDHVHHRLLSIRAGKSALQKQNPKKQASERRRSLRKSRSSRRSGSNSQTSCTASLRDRPLADGPKSSTKARAPRIRFIQRGRPQAGAELAPSIAFASGRAPEHERDARARSPVLLQPRPTPRSRASSP